MQQRGRLFRLVMGLLWTLAGWVWLALICLVAQTVLAVSIVADVFRLGILAVPCACAVLTMGGRLPGTSPTKRTRGRLWWFLVFGALCIPVITITSVVVSLVNMEKGYSTRMAQAERCVPAVLRALEADGRFSAIRVGPTSDEGGALMVSAVVEPGDAAHVMQIVGSTAPGTPVVYDLHELKPSETRPVP